MTLRLGWALPIVMIFIGLYVYTLGFTTSLSEFDSYATADGLLQGYRHGGIGSSAQYDSWYDYGYILMTYRFGRPSDFVAFQSVAQFMNRIGAWSSILSVPLLFFAIRSIYSARIASVTIALFFLSPMYINIAGGSHQVLPMLAFFSAGAWALWAGTRRYRLLLWSLATLFLTFAVMIRFDACFGFPMLVLAYGKPESLKSMIRPCTLRLLPTVIPIILFYIVRYLLGIHGDAQARFLQQYYLVSNIPKGGVAFLIACGVATVLLLAILIVRSIPKMHSAAPEVYAPYLAPIITIFVAMLFWLANPFPDRHFLFAVLGVAASTALLIEADRKRILAVVMAILANYVIAAAANPVVLRTSTLFSTLKYQRKYHPSIDAGWPWQRRLNLKSYMSHADDLGACVYRNSEWKKAALVTDNLPNITGMFLNRTASPSFLTLRNDKDVKVVVIQDGDRQLFVVRRESDFRGDVLGPILQDPTFDHIGIDPTSMRRGDTLPPAYRHLAPGCGD